MTFNSILFIKSINSFDAASKHLTKKVFSAKLQSLFFCSVMRRFKKQM